MKNYIDKYGRIHHKPVTEETPCPSNNAWIYSAYYVKAGGKLNQVLLSEAFRDSVHKREDGVLYTTRHPNGLYTKVPQSRDELLGMAFLGLLKKEHLNGWNFSPFIVPKFKILSFIKQAREAYGKHRNYFWLNGLSQLYHVAFSVPVQDRAFMLECFGEKRSLRYLFYKAIALLDAKFAKPKNGIHWLKYGGEDRKKLMLPEFSEDHPIRNLP